MPDKNPWPPTREDLERLYLVEKLSAAKIARVYGLNYKSAKVAESTVLYQLKRNWISRRDRVGLDTKFGEELVDLALAVSEQIESIIGIPKILKACQTVM